jgi:ABC-type proline/glycine betaine transport system permease subunit
MTVSDLARLIGPPESRSLRSRLDAWLHEAHALRRLLQEAHADKARALDVARLDALGRTLLDDLAALGDDPLVLARATVLLPNRRAVRALGEAFLVTGDGKPLLLPRLAAIGDQYEQAARDLGASRLQAIRLVLLPMAVPILVVVFLLAFAALWPILLNTAAGVAALDPDWLALARSLSATRRELILRIVLPGITAHLLTGVRLAIGLLWIVIVPAEMLGVSAGLGYFVLDTRDRLAYPELMAAIVLIGALGWALDALARGLHARWAGSGQPGGATLRAAARLLRQRLGGWFSRAAAARRCGHRWSAGRRSPRTRGSPRSSPPSRTTRPRR